MSQVITNPQPKARFQLSNDNIAAHREMVGSREFERACDFAVLQYSAALASQSLEPNNAMSVGLKLQGALEFLQTLRMLSETPKVPTPTLIDGNLDHRS